LSDDLAAARFAGVYAATTTPFRADGSVDFGQFGKHCVWLIEEGVAGLIPNGSLGEYEALSDAERAEIVTTAIDAADGRSRCCRACQPSPAPRRAAGPNRPPRRARPR